MFAHTPCYEVGARLGVVEKSAHQCFSLSVQECVPDEVPHLEVRLSHIKTALLLKSASSKPLKEILEKPESVERVMCLHASVKDSAQKAQESLPQAQHWLHNLETEDTEKKVQELKAGCLELACAQLQAAVDELKPVCEGAPDGASWKAGLQQSPSLNELVAHAKHLLKGDTARAIQSKTKALKQDLTDSQPRTDPCQF